MIYLLDNRKTLEISGPDASKFINSLSTNNVTSLAVGKACYNTILDQRSRFLYDFFVYKKTPDSLLIDIFCDFVPGYLELINKYKLRSKFEIDSTTNHRVFVSTAESAESEISFTDPRNDALGIRHYPLDSQNKTSVALSVDEYYNFLVEKQIVAGEWLEQGKSFILEYGFEAINAVDFNKGCYLGQELITRTKRTGTIRKRPKTTQTLTPDAVVIRKHTTKQMFLILEKF